MKLNVAAAIMSALEDQRQRDLARLRMTPLLALNFSLADVLNEALSMMERPLSFEDLARG